MRAAGALITALAAACGGEEPVYRDLPVVVDGAPEPSYQAGPPALVPGSFEAEAFRPLAEGDPLPIVHGLQGGRWIHLAIRVRGVSRRTGRLTVEVSAPPGGDAPLVQNTQEVRPTPAEGWLEVRQTQLHVPTSDVELADLDGRPVQLRVRYEGEGVQVEATLSLVLLDG